jgi:hypothetical protein
VVSSVTDAPSTVDEVMLSAPASATLPVSVTAPEVPLVSSPASALVWPTAPSVTVPDPAPSVSESVLARSAPASPPRQS